ncbi:hypothetical protein POM88_021493 [Heracleum sosnowskyi]|uniref:Uncharacterized protein n=1 Tax=Heracleum sosnowskyi TaxID=360622 RepID=A0AAD8IFZ7_9APIA|nr:hypothetical protein POM88_021493 [Heracleum sosnowskyi]
MNRKTTLESCANLAEKKIQDLNHKLENLQRINDEQKNRILKTERAKSRSISHFSYTGATRGYSIVAPQSLGDGCIRVHGVLYLKFIANSCRIQLQYFKERIPWTRMQSWTRVFSRLLAMLLKRKIGILWNLW